MRSCRPLLRRTLIVLAGMLVLGIVGLAALVAMEWTYIRRLRSHPENLITDVAWYQPREAVVGGDGLALPRSVPGDRGVSGEALEAAARLAEEKNASALLVARADAIVLERYWRGLAADGRTNSASMAKTITSMLHRDRATRA